MGHSTPGIRIRILWLKKLRYGCQIHSWGFAIPVKYPQQLLSWPLWPELLTPCVPCAVARCWWVSGAECALWTESHVLQHERKLPVHRYPLSTQLPTGSCFRVCLTFSSQKYFWKAFSPQPINSVVACNSQEVNNPRGIWHCSVFLPQWMGMKWAHPAAATVALTITVGCQGFPGASPQYVIHHATSRILPQQWAFYRVIFDISWFPFVLPQGFKGSQHLEHSKKYLGCNRDDSPWLHERMEMSKDESTVCLLVYGLAYIPCCLKHYLFLVLNKLLFYFFPPLTEMSYPVQVPSQRGARK